MTEKRRIPIREDGEERDEESRRSVSVVDRRRVGKDPTLKAAEPSLKPTYVEQLEAKVERMETAFKQKSEELEKDAARSRERIKADLEHRFRDAERKLMLEVLDIADDLRRACELTAADPALNQGLSLVLARYNSFLEKHGCEMFSPVGDEFDPEHMEAVRMTDGKKGQVVDVYQPGIYLEGDLLRPAKVSVGAGEVSQTDPS